MVGDIKSPDEVFLYCASKAMRLGYTGFGISPLALQFWPALYAVGFSATALLYMSVYVELYYLPVAVMCAVWARLFWRDHAMLRANSKREWSVNLYKQYGGKAALLRTNTVWVRYLLLSAAMFTTLIAFSDMSGELKKLTMWQRCVFPLNVWTLVALAYSQSAEPPPPSDGDLFGVAGRV
jgi:hypothetical protein